MQRSYEIILMIPLYYKIEILAKVDLKIQFGGKGLKEQTIFIFYSMI